MSLLLRCSQLHVQVVVNFALYSTGATGVTLCLFTEADLKNGRVSFEVDLDADYNKTGDIWHIALPQLDVTLLYGMIATPWPRSQQCMFMSNSSRS